MLTKFWQLGRGMTENVGEKYDLRITIYEMVRSAKLFYGLPIKIDDVSFDLIVALKWWFQSLQLEN